MRYSEACRPQARTSASTKERFTSSRRIGNSGPLATPEIEQEVKDHDLNVVSVLSGNRNFEGGIHPLVKSSYLASPPLVVAYALSGTVPIDLQDQPLGDGKSGKPVFLKDIWPTPDEVNALM